MYPLLNIYVNVSLSTEVIHSEMKKTAVSTNQILLAFPSVSDSA
jgi:hypothetical protein